MRNTFKVIKEYKDKEVEITLVELMNGRARGIIVDRVGEYQRRILGYTTVGASNRYNRLVEKRIEQLKEMEKMKDGLYEVFGNTVRVEDGCAFDIDANEEMPIELVEEMGEWIGEE